MKKLLLIVFGIGFVISACSLNDLDSTNNGADGSSGIESRSLSTDLVYMFYDKSGDDNPVFYRALSQNLDDTLTIGSETNISSYNISHIGTPVQYDGNMYLFYRGAEDKLRYSKYVNNNWVNHNEVDSAPRTRSTPAVAVYNNQIHVVFRGNNSPFRLYHTIATDIENNVWTPFEYIAPKSVDSPDLAVHDNRLFLYFTSQDTNKIYTQYYENGVWSTLYDISSETDRSLGVCSVDDTMYLFYRNRHDGYIYYKTSSNGITFNSYIQVTGMQSSKGPSVVAVDDIIYAFITANYANTHIKYKIIDSNNGNQYPSNVSIDTGVTAVYEPGLVYFQ